MNTLAKKIGQKLSDMKGDGVIVADVSNITPLCEAYVIAGANSDRKLNGMVDAVYQVCKEEEHPISHVEGKNGSKWIVVDCYDVVVHLFERHERERVKLDQIIVKCPQESLSELEEVEPVTPNNTFIDDSYEDYD